MGDEAKRDVCLELLVEPVFVAATYKDADGRPLAEMNAPRGLRAGVEMELSASTFPGSRHGKLMNVSAMKQVSTAWPDLVGIMVQLRTAYMERAGTTELSLAGFWRLSRVFTSISVYLARRSDAPLDTERIPVPVSAIFKTGQGLHMISERMLLAGIDPHRNPSAEEIIEFGEDHDLFLSFDQKRACAGPPHLIEELVSKVLSGDAATPPGDERLEKAVGRLESLFDYADSVTSIAAGRILFEGEARMAVGRLLGTDEFRGPADETAASELRAVADKNLRRFGRFMGATVEEISRVYRSFSAIAPKPGEDAVDEAEGRSSREAIGTFLRDTKPEVSAAFLDACADQLLRHLQEERRWMVHFQSLQRDVLRALGRPESLPALTARDLISTTGFTPSDVVSAWLKAEIRNERGRPVEITPRRIAS